MSSNLSRLEKTGILFAIAASAASISGFQLDKYFEKHADPSGVWKAESPGGMAYSKCLYVQELTDRKYNAWMLDCLLYTSPSPRDKRQSRMPSSA